MRRPGTSSSSSSSARLALALLVCLASRACQADGGLGCRDESGEPVDYFVALKFPDGSNYAYADSRTAHSGFASSPFDLASKTDGAVAKTLAGVYDADSDDVGHVQYNDAWPDDHKHGTGGHTKGFLGFTSTGGFWLVHSVPRFPSFVSDGYPGLPDDEDR